MNNVVKLQKLFTAPHLFFFSNLQDIAYNQETPLIEINIRFLCSFKNKHYFCTTNFP